jgi:hypothetical protein
LAWKILQKSFFAGNRVLCIWGLIFAVFVEGLGINFMYFELARPQASQPGSQTTSQPDSQASRQSDSQL